MLRRRQRTVKKINSLCELSVKQFQKQMDLNVDVLHKAASGCLRLSNAKRRRENRSKFSEAVYDRDGNVEKVRWRIFIGLPSPSKLNKNLSKKRPAEEEGNDASMMVVDDDVDVDDDKNNNNNNNNNDYAQPTIVAFNFERFFLDNTATFYAKESEKRFGITRKSAGECAEYLKHCQTRLNEETLNRAESYLQPQTKLALTKTVEKALIEDKKIEIIDSSNEMLADSSKVDDLKRLYSLLSRVPDGLKLLRDQFTKRIKFVGQKTVQDEAADCVDVLLQMKSSVDDIVANAFENHRQFSEGAKDAFEMFINTSKNNRIAELIAKFMDEKLKKGYKTTSSTEKELDEQLNKAVALFRFIQGKDVFEAFYKKDLAKRLLFQNQRPSTPND